MTKQIGRSWRSVAMTMAVATGAALAGLAVAPSRAAASMEMNTYTCAPYDVCMPGEQRCCSEFIQIPPGQGRCTTVCDVPGGD